MIARLFAIALAILFASMVGARADTAPGLPSFHITFLDGFKNEPVEFICRKQKGLLFRHYDGLAHGHRV